MRKYARTDSNQDQVVSELRSAGASVQSLAAVGGGVPDLLVGFRGETYLLEVKDEKQPPSKRKLTKDQVEWHSSWTGGALIVVDGPESALEAVGAV